MGVVQDLAKIQLQGPTILHILDAVLGERRQVFHDPFVLLLRANLPLFQRGFRRCLTRFFVADRDISAIKPDSLAVRERDRERRRLDRLHLVATGAIHHLLSLLEQAVVCELVE